MNGHGGRREGAGRRPGAVSTRSREVADRAAAQDVTPLSVMLEAMHASRDKGDLAAAAGYAKDAAPYIHPRLSAVQVDAEHNGRFLVQSVEGVAADDILGNGHVALPAAGGGD